MLIDSSVLFALHDPDDKYHQEALRFFATYRGNQIVPEVTLVEVTQMLYRHTGQREVLAFLDSLNSPRITLQSLILSDVQRAREIMATYAESRLDLVDCCLIALAERMNITQICTFDRRDFAMVRPSHAQYLELLP